MGEKSSKLVGHAKGLVYCGVLAASSIAMLSSLTTTSTVEACSPRCGTIAGCPGGYGAVVEAVCATCSNLILDCCPSDTGYYLAGCERESGHTLNYCLHCKITDALGYDFNIDRCCPA
jgi:hypothetical protein